jgi:transcriptional regulator with XRE-family HTH domain
MQTFFLAPILWDRSASGTWHGVNGMKRRASEHPHPVDIHVGGRVRLRRTLLGMSQERLGRALGLTFQQVQKYERGANRIGASRLYQLCRILDVPVSFFFDDMAAETTDRSVQMRDAGHPDPEPDRFSKRETLELVRAYYRIDDPEVRRRLFELTKSIAPLAE